MKTTIPKKRKVTNPLLSIDAYKLGHMSMYPKKTEKMYCNLTARSFKHFRNSLPKDFKYFNNKVVVLGISGTIQEIFKDFEEGFFSQDLNIIMEDFKNTILPYAGENGIDMLLSKVESLHKLGYLPLKFKSLPEGTQVGEGIPIMTWTNTHKDFAWLPNYLETLISSQVWKTITTATIAKTYRNIFEDYSKRTGSDRNFIDFQGHDFSSRGMSGIIDASRSGIGHASSFKGTDAVSIVSYVNEFYNPKNKNLFIGASVPATEHSVMCLGGKETEKNTYLRLFKNFPKGIISIVSDTWDYWGLLKKTLPKLKYEINNREDDSLGNSKVVIRPDSGEPVDIVCGTKKGLDINLTPQEKGSIVVLEETFGSTINDKGLKTLNSKIGLIYGDSITLTRADTILRKLLDKGFASDNIVLGIGSYTYQFITRDTFGMAVKATYAVIDGVGVKIFKDPKTDPGKKSSKGMMVVTKDTNGDYIMKDDLTSDDGGELKTIFKDGEFYDLPSWDDICQRIANDK